MGIVYYSRYFEYFEEARTELLRSVGISIPSIEGKGYYLPVISCKCTYKNSIRFDDDIIINTKIKDLPSAKLTIEYRVMNSSNILCAFGETIHTFINRKGKAVKPPKEIIKILRG
jgi:acyl-CoA thioester hydrolase